MRSGPEDAGSADLPVIPGPPEAIGDHGEFRIADF